MLHGNKEKKGTFLRDKVVQEENRAVLGGEALSRTTRPESRSDIPQADLARGLKSKGTKPWQPQCLRTSDMDKDTARPMWDRSHLGVHSAVGTGSLECRHGLFQP